MERKTLFSTDLVIRSKHTKATWLPSGADDEPTKVNHLRRFLFWAIRCGVTNPRAISSCKKSTANNLENPERERARTRRRLLADKSCLIVRVIDLGFQPKTKSNRIHPRKPFFQKKFGCFVRLRTEQSTNRPPPAQFQPQFLIDNSRLWNVIFFIGFSGEGGDTGLMDDDEKARLQQFLFWAVLAGIVIYIVMKHAGVDDGSF
jgi:hypothetical protein